MTARSPLCYMAGMKPRYAAALALVGWYLMTPKVVRRFPFHRHPFRRCEMKPQLNDTEAERILDDENYIWSDTRKGYVRARRKGQSPDSISLEELSDNGLTDPHALHRERRDVLVWLAERIKQGS